MRCPTCNAENPDATKFCGNCGQPLKNRCVKCGAENPPQFKFCGECGSSLIEPAAPETVGDSTANLDLSVSETRDGGLTGERRHLTVLFCDLLGSTEIAAQLDPEDWRAVVAAYNHAAGRAIERFGGYVAKYLGDGVMAYFGYPEAHDNDAERAARAGLAILDAIAKLNEESARPRLSARVGIDSGAVVVGAGAGTEADVFGEAPNIAARVQAAAEPGTVLITAATHRLVSGLFVVESRGAQPLKGVATPIELFQVVRPTGVRARVVLAHGLTPFVGRGEELRLLLSRWERTREGDGQVALVVGEAGIGKSRLIAEFHDRIRDLPHIWTESAGEQFFENTPFHAVTEMLSQWLELQGGATPAEHAERLERALASAGLKPEETVPLVADLLQLPLSEHYPALTLTPEQKRQRLLAALAGWTFGAARLQPLVMVFEDLQWLDPSTLELQQLLAEQAATAPVMLLCTARPEFRAQWPMRGHHTQITLNRLSARSVRSMVAEVAAQKALSDETITAVVERTGGVPLFVEELTRAVLESGDAKLTGREIPVTLHDSLMARLDRLGPAKEVIQVGAVIGGEFSYELLHAVYPISEAELRRALQKLADAELLYVRGIAPDVTYRFKHALIRDAAYEALLRSRRKRLHRLVARTIDEKFPALKEAHPEVLARHWTEAGETAPAIAEWSRMGRAAQARSAFREAEEAYRQALAILEKQPESRERDARELELKSALGEVLQITKGYASPEAFDAKTRARVLAEKSANLAQVVVDLIGTWIAATTSGDHSAANEVADRMLDLAEREGSAANRGFAHMVKLCTCYYRGDFVGCEKYFARGREFFDAPDFRKFRGAVSNTFGLADLNAWTMGRADVARERAEHALSAARENESAYDLAFALHQESNLRMLLREPGRAEAAAAQALALSEEHGFPYFGATCQIALGWARAQLGQVQEGIRLIRRGLTEMARNGIRNFIPRYLTYLAAAQALDGAPADALGTIEQALQTNPQELLYRPETIRLRAEVELSLGRVEQAEADFREAISLAKEMSAKGWELRATLSLAPLLAEQRRRAEARAMLAEIYNWFKEGFDTADLKNAKVLLDELSG